MTTEEKAKAYDKALEKARRMHNSKYHPSEGPSGVYLNNADLEEIFPELKESEDERIRKELVDFVNHYRHNTDLTTEQAEWAKKAIAYLEKHIEQKPVGDGTRAKIISRATSEKQVVLVSESDGNAEIGWDARSLEDAKNLLEYGISFINEQLGVKPAEWSEEDENAIKYFHELISFGFTEKFCDAQTAADMKEWLNTKLKSLRPHWKPKGQQLDCLRRMINVSTVDKIDKQFVQDLYDELMAL